MAGACGGHFGCKWLREGLAHPPVPWSMPRARCPLSGLKLESCQFEIFVREERSRTSRLLRLQLCANIHSHFVTSPTMPNHVCCSATRQTRGGQASACSRHKSNKPKSELLSFALLCRHHSAPRGASGRLPLSGGWVFGGCGCVAGHAPCEESWLVHASQPQSTHTLPCLVCLVF